MSTRRELTRTSPWPLFLHRLRGEGLGAQLLRGGAGTALLKISNTLLMFCLTVLLTRILGVEEYGFYAFVLAGVTILGIPAQFGMQLLVVREIAAAHAKEQWGVLRGILRRGLQTVAVASISTVIVASFAMWLFVSEKRMPGGYGIVCAFVLVVTMAFGNLVGGCLRGFRRVVQGELPERIFRPGIFLALLATLPVVSRADADHAETALALHAAAGIVALWAGGVLLKRQIPALVTEAEPSYDTRSWLRSGLSLSLVGSLHVINTQADVVILGALRSSEETGIYRAAAQVALLGAFALQAVNIVAAPQISRLYRAEDKHRLQRVATWSARCAAAFALPALLVFLIFGDELLRRIFGNAFAAGHLPLTILGIGHFVSATMGSVVFLLNMTGSEAIVARALAVAAVANIVLNLVLVPALGPVGAAVSTAVTIGLWNLILTWQVRSRLGIDSTCFGLASRWSEEVH